MSASRARLPDGRLHFQHGPIDIVIGADGDAAAVASAHADAWRRFSGVLAELVGELALLRRPVVAGDCPVAGPVARRMWAACRPYADIFITPMAAVAGSVAQELIACYDRPGIDRAWVNDGGDIAWHLAPGRSLRLGLYADMARFDAAELNDGIRIDGSVELTHSMAARGVATSGWRGRSFSLGIADSVTVFARTAAAADAAATVIANAVDVDDARIVRRRADELKDDSDLGDDRGHRRRAGAAAGAGAHRARVGAAPRRGVARRRADRIVHAGLPAAGGRRRRDGRRRRHRRRCRPAAGAAAVRADRVRSRRRGPCLKRTPEECRR